MADRVKEPPVISELDRQLGGGQMSIDEKVSSVEAAAPLQITVSQMEDRTLIVVAGELDDFTAPFLRRRLTEEIEDGAGEVVLDIGLLTFVDSSGLALA